MSAAAESQATVRPSRRDEADLRVYFEHGVDFFAPPSAFGRQLELAEAFSVELRPCRRCGGRDGYYAGGELVAEVPGSGYVSGPGDAATARYGAPGADTCPKCKGMGWLRRAARPTRPPTVQQTGSSVIGYQGEPGGNVERLERYGRVDRILYRVNRRDPLLWCVLRAYYSPGGSTGSLWIHTPTGAALYAARLNKDITERQFFDAESQVQQKRPTAARGAALAACATEAAALLTEAWTTWTSIASEMRATQRPRRSPSGPSSG